jgi:hypothetical protein
MIEGSDGPAKYTSSSLDADDIEDFSSYYLYQRKWRLSHKSSEAFICDRRSSSSIESYPVHLCDCTVHIRICPVHVVDALHFLG